MHKIDSPNHVANQFVDRDPVGGTPGTTVDDDFMNAIQGELVSIIEGAGVVLAKGTNTQLRQAIKRLFGGNVTTVAFGDSPKALSLDESGLVLVDATGGNVVINLPAANLLGGLRYRFHRTDATANTVTVNRNGADTIDEGLTNFTLSGEGDGREIVSDKISAWLSFVKKGGANGYVSLDGSGKVPDAQIAAIIHGVTLDSGGVLPKLADEVYDAAETIISYPLGISVFKVTTGGLAGGWPGDYASVWTFKNEGSWGWQCFVKLGLVSAIWVRSFSTVWGDFNQLWNEGNDTPLEKIANKDVANGYAGLNGSSQLAASVIPDASISQAKLKTTAGVVSTGAAAELLTLAGGYYSFWPNIKLNSSQTGGIVAAPGSPFDASGALFNPGIGTSYLARIMLGEDTAASTVYANIRYVQSSPPYDLGDGEVPLFVFVVVKSNGEIESTYVAPDPPWANNGPTKINATHLKDGMPYRWELASRPVRPPKGASKAKKDAFAAALEAGPEWVEVEITQALKQADMALIPHAFLGNDMTDRTIIVIDPPSGMSAKLLELHEAGGDDFGVSELIHEDYLRLDNIDLPRAKPPGVMAVAARWRNSG